MGSVRAVLSEILFPCFRYTHTSLVYPCFFSVHVQLADLHRYGLKPNWSAAIRQESQESIQWTQQQGERRPREQKYRSGKGLTASPAVFFLSYDVHGLFLSHVFVLLVCGLQQNGNGLAFAIQACVWLSCGPLIVEERADCRSQETLRTPSETTVSQCPPALWMFCILFFVFVGYSSFRTLLFVVFCFSFRLVSSLWTGTPKWFPTSSTATKRANSVRSSRFIK